jgi:S-DNA-T family DNA segregation ATPase FtsK/SpoIIIE
VSTVVVHRPARTTEPGAELAPIPIEAPPALPDDRAGSNLQMLLPALGGTSSLAMMFLYRGSGYVVIGALVLAGTLVASGALMLSARGRATRERRARRERYLDYLDELRETLVARERAGRDLARELNPPPPALFDVVRDPARRWERRRRDRDFLTVRIGAGVLPVCPVRLPEAGNALHPSDPFMLAEARSVHRRFARSPGVPLLVPLDRAGDVSIVGPRGAVLRAAQALLAQVVAWHAARDVTVGLAHGAEYAGDWAAAKWLPHVAHPVRRDGPVPARRIAPTPGELAELLADEIAERTAYAAQARRNGIGADPGTRPHRLLVVHDTYGQVATPLGGEAAPLPAGELGVTVLHLVADRLQEPEQVAVRLRVEGDAVTVEDLRGPEPVVHHGRLDPAPPALLSSLARMLAPLRLSNEPTDGEPDAAAVGLPALLGIADPAALDIARLWGGRSERDFLRVPLGVDDAGAPVLLDLKESAQLGMGPHGLCVGATGSGKSELLRTLVLALAATHSPAELALVLIDYKGGATFAPFGTLPQVAGVITNLEDDAGLIERAYTSLDGEVRRRQQVLRDAGGVANIADYRTLRERSRPDLPPLPYLLVIIDEFGELLTYRPDFIELFLTIGRIGRSIGVHLLLSSQRMESGKLKGLDAYLSYRLGLRTFSEAESRTVLDTADAFHLPPLPGFGYLKVDTTIYRRLKAGYCSGPYHEAAEAAVPDGATVREYPAYNTPADPGAAGEPVLPERSVGDTLLSVMVDQLAAAAAPVHQIWLPVLPTRVALDELTGAPKSGRDGLRLPGRCGELRVPLGLIDDPARQRQQLWRVDLTAGGGHLVVVGAPQSGKTTLLRTMVAGLALTHTPAQVAIYGIDLMGAGLGALAGFPHVAGVAGRTDRERIRRTVEELRGALDRRETLFRERGIDSVAQLRARHAAAELPELASADLVLVADGLGAVRGDFEELEAGLDELLQRGARYGVHVVATLLRPNDVRLAWLSTFGTRLELRLGDPADSTTGRRLAGTLRVDQPGRVLTPDNLFAQTALPPGGEGGAGLERLAEVSRALWPGDPVPPVRVLPRTLPAILLPDATAEPAAVPVGVDEERLRPVLLDLFDADPHLLVLGDGRCGKTNLLRVVATGLLARHSDQRLVFAVLDPRRGLRGLLREPYLGGYANAHNAQALAAGVAQELAKRTPHGGPDGFPGQHIVVLVDDHDVLTAADPQALQPLLPYLPAAREVGLHLVLTRRVSGAARGMYEPAVLALRESGATGLVMAGDRGEGQLFPGVYPAPQPPGRGRWVRPGELGRLIQTVLAEA